MADNGAEDILRSSQIHSEAQQSDNSDDNGQTHWYEALDEDEDDEDYRDEPEEEEDDDDVFHGESCIMVIDWKYAKYYQTRYLKMTSSLK